uniref:glycosyltransferase family 4 protein n=1 Tax=Luteococcus sp. TaxID=1969402 RepID=UPI00373664EE
MLTQHFPPQPGVHADRWEWMGRALREAGHELDVVVPMWRNQPRLTVDDPRLEVHEVRALVPGLGLRRRITNEALALAQSLLLALRTPRPDVVLATVPALSTLPLGWAVSHLRRAPLLLELRDAWPHLLDEMASWNDDGTTSRPPAPGSTAAVAVPLARLMWHLERRARAVVVTSDSLREELEAAGFGPVLLARNVALRPAHPAPAREPDGELHVLYLGSFGRAQKLATAVRAAAIAHRAGVSVRLRLVGSGVHEVPLRHLAERLGAPVDFVERVPGAVVAEHYAWADSVLVMLRGWNGMELTVPSKLYEALASGRHVSASVTGEAARIVEESGAGDVTAPDDAEALARLWQELAADPSRLQVGDGGRCWVQQWATPEAGVRTMLDALELAAGQRQDRAWAPAALVQDAVLTLGTVASHMDGDSATFFVQLARRTGLARRVRTGRGPRAWQVVAAHLADRPDELQRSVAEI